jgi:hypothetical protein
MYKPHYIYIDKWRVHQCTLYNTHARVRMHTLLRGPVNGQTKSTISLSCVLRRTAVAPTIETFANSKPPSQHRRGPWFIHFDTAPTLNVRTIYYISPNLLLQFRAPPAAKSGTRYRTQARYTLAQCRKWVDINFHFGRGVVKKVWILSNIFDSYFK